MSDMTPEEIGKRLRVIRKAARELMEGTADLGLKGLMEAVLESPFVVHAGPDMQAEAPKAAEKKEEPKEEESHRRSGPGGRR